MDAQKLLAAIQDLVLRPMRNALFVTEHAAGIGAVKRQSIRRRLPLARAFQTRVRRRSSAKLATRLWPKHSRDHRLASSSAGLSQLPCLGV